MPHSDHRTLGAACRGLWLLEPSRIYLNHGSFGAAPRTVLAAQREWRERMERDPGEFMCRILPGAIREAAAILARFVGASGSDLAFVANATAGCNAVLQSLDLGPGDEILVTDHGYAAIRKAAEHVARRAGARVVEARIPFPLPGPAAVTEAVRRTLSPRTRLAIFDHATSPTAAVFPVRELAALCRETGVMVLIDGAHAPGMLPLALPEIGADFYVGNCHKWLMAPKGAGFLWAAPEARPGLHPTVISHGYGAGFTAEFDWTGTYDPSALLSVPAAIDFHQSLGGAALMRRNAALAREAAIRLAGFWGTETGTTEAMTGSMATIRLPLEPGACRSQEQADSLRFALYDRHGIDMPVIFFAGACWARISAQAYNEMADYERLAEAFGRAP